LMPSGLAWRLLRTSIFWRFLLQHCSCHDPDNVSYAVPLLHDRLSLCGRKPTSSGTHPCPGSVPSAFHSSLRLDADPHAASIVWQFNDQDPIQFPVIPLLAPDCHDLGGVTLRWGLDWMIGFIATTGNYNSYSTISGLHTLQFTVTHTRVLSILQSALFRFSGVMSQYLLFYIYIYIYW
jgi:hypothetical protein